MGTDTHDDLEPRYGRLLDATPDAMIVTDEAGRVVLVNIAAESLFGWTRAELLGREVETLVPERFRAAHPGHRRRYREASRYRMMGEGGIALFGLRKDGSEFPAEISLSPVTTERGTLTITAIRDVSERRRLDEELERARDAALAANQELESFSYAVAHDLRAPLRAIIGFGEILLQDYAGALDERGQRFVQRMHAAAGRMNGLIDALHALSRVGRVEPKRERVDLTRLARSVAAQLREAQPARKVDVAIADGLAAIGDEQLLRALLDNLLGNAWKFTAQRDSARIEVGAREEQGGGTAFFVRDDGAGFDMAKADKLFAPFQRLHAASQFPGSGIGLATAQRIVQRHGGHIWAEAAVEEGATFFFTLPTPGASPAPRP